MSHRARQYSGWSVAIVVVVVISLMPVLWILLLSLKTSASATDGSFIPHHWTLSNYSDIFKLGTFTSALRNSIGIALIATVLAVMLASAAAYAIARLDFPGKRRHPRGRARRGDVPADLARRPAVQPVAPDRALRHLAGTDHPLHDVRPAAVDLHPVGVLQRDPLGARAGGAGRRRDAPSRPSAR